jgi:hypothetical protein
MLSTEWYVYVYCTIEVNFPWLSKDLSSWQTRLDCHQSLHRICFVFQSTISTTTRSGQASGLIHATRQTLLIHIHRERDRRTNAICNQASFINNCSWMHQRNYTRKSSNNETHCTLDEAHAMLSKLLGLRGGTFDMLKCETSWWCEAIQQTTRSIWFPYSITKNRPMRNCKSSSQNTTVLNCWKNPPHWSKWGNRKEI